MLLGRYQFSCILIDEAHLPPYKGSTFRGAFGNALKKVVCTTRENTCATCLLASRCLYARTFESLPQTPEAGSPRPHPPPHPYVIEPPLSTATRFQPGDAFDFTLLLFGETNDFFPYFVYAFETMGKEGIGKKMNGRRARFSVTGVTLDGTCIFDGQARRLSADIPPAHLALAPAPEDLVGHLTIRLRTPLRLKFENRLRAELPFHVLVRAMLRRISGLFAAYGDGEPDLDYRGLVARAAAVEIASSDLQWVDWERYSNRQDQKMLMGGLQGTITYEGNLNEFVPLLKYCEEVNLGKQTTFGLGRISVEV